MKNLNIDFLELYKFLDVNYKPQSEDVFYSLELLLESIRNSKNAILETMKDNVGDLAKVSSLLKYAEKIENIENILNDYLDSFVISYSNDEEIIDDDEDDEKRNIPNYKEFEVDQETPHLLTESFTHKKICSFFFNNIRYNTSDWKSALVKLCEILHNIDSYKFINIVKSKQFNGKKRNYFSFDGNGKYYRKLENSEIYVWTCHSANAICAIIRKLLREYNIPMNSMYIYLRADYTPLHNIIPDAANEHIVDEEVKIGKFVRESMRKLSNQNYKFENDMILKLTNDYDTKKMFGIGTSFFREVKQGVDISTLTKDVKGYNRYWKEIFRFNNKEYLLVSQWTKNNSDRFHKWFSRLPKT